MKTRDKQLLLKDLCARLFYIDNLKVADSLKVAKYCERDGKISDLIHELRFTIGLYELSFRNPNVIIKPYLRPMSSMTEEEFVYFMGLRGRMLQSYEIQSMMKKAFNAPKSMLIVTQLGNYSNKIDWLIAHHFDYRGLIPMGLALEATEGMYQF